jgi:hypothetical protein
MSELEKAESVFNAWEEVEKGARNIYVLARDNLELALLGKQKAENYLCELRHKEEQ